MSSCTDSTMTENIQGTAESIKESPGLSPAPVNKKLGEKLFFSTHFILYIIYIVYNMCVCVYCTRYYTSSIDDLSVYRFYTNILPFLCKELELGMVPHV